MDTKKKKLSRGANGRAAFISVLAALLCIVIGLICGYLALMVINAQHAWSDGFVRILQGGFYDAPYGVGRTLANAAPLIMTGLSVAFAFKTGLFNIGAAGQYTLGAYGALYCAIILHLPWYLSLIVATILGGLEVDEEGSLSNWIIPGKKMPGMGEEGPIDRLYLTVPAGEDPALAHTLADLAGFHFETEVCTGLGQAIQQARAAGGRGVVICGSEALALEAEHLLEN